MLGPMFWSLFYDDLLPGVSIVGYADDAAVMTTAHNTSLVEDVLNLALCCRVTHVERARTHRRKDGGDNAH